MSHCKACDAQLSGNPFKVFTDPVTDIEYPFEEDMCSYCLDHVEVDEFTERMLYEDGYWSAHEETRS